jgi:hypothetical protein
MAKLKNGILGPISGKINGYIASSWRNVNYIKRASPVNHRPRSVAQIAQQEKFKFAQRLVKPMRLYFINGFQHLAIENSQLNLAFALNYKAIEGSYPDLSIDYDQVFISQGNLTPLQDVVMHQPAPNVIELNWDIDFLDPLLRTDDQVMLMLYCHRLDATDGFFGAANRSAKTCSFTLPKKMLGQQVEVFAGAIAANRRDAANSVHVGTIRPSGF